MAVLAVGAGGEIVVAILPWRKLFESGLGIPFLYAWSVMDIALVSVGIAVSGGGRSELFVVYGLTTVFFGTSYPIGGQVVLLGFTYACYLSVLAATGWDVAPGSLFLRLALLAILVVLTSFLSRELVGQMESADESRSRSERWASLLRTVADAARSMTLDPGRVVEAALEAVMALGFEGAALCALDPDGETYRVVQTQGLPDGIAGSTFPASVGVTGLVLQNGKTVILDDYDTAPEAIPVVRDAGFRSVVGSPLWVQGWLTGVLIGGSWQKGRMGQQEVEAFELLAAGSGMALENARRFEEEHQAVERLEELDRMKSDFLATVSHELRTPITVIEGAGLTLERTWDAVDDQTKRDLLRGLTSNARALDGLITNLLDFSRLEAGRLEVRFGPLELTGLLGQIANRLLPLFAEHPLVVEVDDGLVVDADAMLIDRVVENLLTNAVKHTPRETRVRLSSHRDADDVVVAVADEGLGIPAEELAHLGERFFRGGDLNTRTRGLGLGLALAREALELHGSALEIESHVGEGSRFSFRLRPTATEGGTAPSEALRAS